MLPQSRGHMDACEHQEGLGRAVCRCCGVHTTSEGHLAAHVAGRKHAKRMELFRCDICNFYSSSQVTMAQHWGSRRHRVRLPTVVPQPLQSPSLVTLILILPIGMIISLFI